MRVRVASSAKAGADMLCAFVFSGDGSRGVRGAPKTGDKGLDLEILQSARDMAGKAGRITTIPVSSKRPAKRILLAGLGDAGEITHDVIRHVSGSIAKKAREIGVAEFAIIVPDEPLSGTGLDHNAVASAISEGAVMSMYRFDRFKTINDDNNNNNRGADAPPALADTGDAEDGLVSDLLSPLEDSKEPDPNLVIVAPQGAAVADGKKGRGRDAPTPLRSMSDAVRVSEAVSRGNLFVRSVANLPPNVCTPQVLADIARGVAKMHNLRCTIVKKRDLKARGFGGITAVGQGSANEPRLIILEYDGAGGRRGQGSANDADAPIVLVGKAVTFDTGGISIKPGARMDEMKFDKCGGCTVLGIIKTVAELQARSRVVAIIPAVENMPGGESYRPGDIIRLYGGKTAEILNTDAEGRLILADALAYGEQHYKPKEIIDFATLTGACIVALGTNVAGMVSNDDALAGHILDSSVRTAEPVWRLPLDRDYMDMIKSHVADMKNMGMGRAAGTITAAAFLRNAISGDVPWAHLDIAGTAWMQEASKPRSYRSKGATGFGLRLTVDHVLGHDHP